MTRYFFFLVCIIVAYTKAPAQQNAAEPLKQEWAISRSTNNINRYMSDYYLPSYDKSILYLDDEKAVVMTNTRDEYSLRLLNNNGETLWQLIIPGKALGIGKKHNNIVAFYEDNGNDVHAMLVDGSSHQVTSDRDIYSPGKQECNYFVENDPSGNFDHLLIRTVPSAKAEYLGTAKLELIYLDEALLPKSFDITGDLKGGLLAGTVTSDNGIHFITFLSPQGIIVKKYDGGGKVTASLISHVYFSKGARPICTLDAENHRAVCLAFKYKTDDKQDATVCAYADFGAGKMSTSAEQVPDKDYQNEMKGHVIKNPDIKSASLKSLEDLVPVRIITFGGKILVVREVRYNIILGGTTHYYSLHIFISTYSRAMKLVSEMVLEKNSESFLPYCGTIGTHIKNNILYLVTSSLVGSGQNGTVLDVIDLKANKIISTGVPFKQKFLENAVTEGAATIWFDKSYLVDVMHVSNKITKINLSSSLMKMEY